MKTYDMLQKIADYKAETMFTPEAIRRLPLEERQENGLGVAIASWAEWDGLKIMRVFLSALEDANFHRAYKVVEKLYRETEKEFEE